MSAISRTSPFDQLGLDEPFAEGNEGDTDRYVSEPELHELHESPFAEASASEGAWQEGPERMQAGLEDERLAWLDLEAGDSNAQGFGTGSRALDGEVLHRNEPLHEDEKLREYEERDQSALGDTAHEWEYLDDEERDASESHEDYLLQERLDPKTQRAAPLSAQQRAWILALDRSAIERLPDAAMRARFLQQDWSDIEFPGNVPKGQSVTDAIKRHWAMARSLFDAMARVVPERRVPTTIRFRDRPVVKVPGQLTHRLFAEARDAFVRMREAAQADGVDLVILSSWRSRARQAAASANQPNPNAVARRASAHMYGLAIDLRMGVAGLPVKETNTRVDRTAAAKAGTAAKMGNLVRMYRSPVYKWMSLRAGKFGWYPYRNEPWHWEYNPPGLKARFEGESSDEFEQASDGDEARGARSTWEQDQEASIYSEADSEQEGEVPSPLMHTFTANALGVKVAVLVTRAARIARQVEMLVYAHGLDLCKPVFKNRPATFITERPFCLGDVVEASGRPIVLVVPFLDWERLSANGMAFGRRWHRLAKPDVFNRIAAEALEQVCALTRSASPPTLQRLILAGHSRAYGFFDALAHEYASPQMRTGALGQPTHVWALDTTYSAPITDWRAWLQSRNDLRATVVYRHGKYQPKGSTVLRELATGIYGREFGKLATVTNGRLTVMPVAADKVSHCAIPNTYLPRLLASLPALTMRGELEREAHDGDLEDHESGEDVAGLAAEAEALASSGEADSGEWSEGLGGDEEEARSRFDAFGDERDSEWSSESSEEVQSHDNAFDEAEPPLSFEQAERRAGLAGSGLTPTEQKSVAITSLFETGKRGGFYGLSGNFDGQGLSFGLVNWTIGTGSLQPLLRDFANEHPARWLSVFGADASRFQQLIARKGEDARKEQHRFAIEEMNIGSIGAHGKRIWTVREPWVSYFKRLSEDPAFQGIQVRYVRDLLARAEHYCRSFRLTSEQAFAFMFDTVASHGKRWLQKKFGGVEKRRVLIEQRLKALASRYGAARVPEGDALLAIADVLATTSAQRWADKVRQRKRWFVTGQHPRSRELDGLEPRTDVLYTTSKAIASELDSLRFDVAAGESQDVIHGSDRAPNRGGGGPGGGAASAALDPGNFRQFVDDNRMDIEIAHVLNVLDHYPEGSWAKQSASFAHHELVANNLLAFVKGSNSRKAADQIPTALRATEVPRVALNAGALGPSLFAITVADVGAPNTFSGYILVQDELVRKGTQPGPGRKKLALTLVHELSHIRNRVQTKKDIPAMRRDLDTFVRPGDADAAIGAAEFFEEMVGKHIEWRVLKDIEHKWDGKPIPAAAKPRRLFQFALLMPLTGKDMSPARTTYLTRLVTSSNPHDFDRQIGLWLRLIANRALFHDSPTINNMVRQQFLDEFNLVQPAFKNPGVNPDGGVLFDESTASESESSSADNSTEAKNLLFEGPSASVPNVLISPRFAGDQILSACFHDKARLGEGATGPAVAKVQQALVDLGYNLGPAGADAKYGSATAAAVRAFKLKEQLGSEQFGDVGPGTMRRLDRIFANEPHSDRLERGPLISERDEGFVPILLAPPSALQVPPDEGDCPPQPGPVAFNVVGFEQPTLEDGGGSGDPCLLAPAPAGAISDFERDVRNNRGRIMAVVLDPENPDEIIGYRIRTDPTVLQIVDREGNFVSGNEKSLDTPMLDPIDFIPSPGGIAKGTVAIGKVGLKVLGKLITKDVSSKSLWKISAAAIPRLRGISAEMLRRASRAAVKDIPNVARRITEEGLNHSFDRHAAQWFGGVVQRTTHFDLWRQVVQRASVSSSVFPWSLGANKTIGHLALIDGKHLVVHFFAETGELASAFVPSQRQVSQILLLLAKMK